MKESGFIWGIDLGGTKVEGVILGPGGLNEVVFRDRLPTGAQNGYDAILNQVVTLAAAMEAAFGSRPKHIGIGTPGTFDPVIGLMRGCNSECLNGKPLRDDLERLLSLRVVIANDANCFALAETRLGVVKHRYPDAQVVFGVILGTGVGGGLVVHGSPINGLHGIAGEWGHNFLDDSGGECFCGKVGCVEKILAGPALEAYHHSISGETLSLQEIHRASKEGDKNARLTIRRLTDYFGKAISGIINTIDPDVIVVGGGVGRIDEIYTDGKEAAKKYIFNSGIMETAIVPPMLGDSAGVFGAAYLTLSSLD